MTIYKFVIDTDSYSGNFERELCAYCTGQVGECGIGEEEAAEVPEDIKGLFDETVERAPDDENGCIRPVVLVATPGYWNDGDGNHFKGEVPAHSYPAYQSVGILFSEPPTDKMVDIMIQRAKEYAARPNKYGFLSFSITGFRLIKTIEVEDQLRSWKP